MNVRDVANMAAVYVPGDESESMRIAYCNDEDACFVAIGEESGEEYVINYADVDLNTSLFYKLVLIETD